MALRHADLFAEFFNIFVLFCGMAFRSPQRDAIFFVGADPPGNGAASATDCSCALQGYTVRARIEFKFYEFGESKPNDDIINYDYEWQGPRSTHLANWL